MNKGSKLSHLQEMFKDKVEPDVVELVFTECQHKVDDAVVQLLTLTEETKTLSGSKCSMAASEQTSKRTTQPHNELQNSKDREQCSITLKSTKFLTNTCVSDKKLKSIQSTVTGFNSKSASPIHNKTVEDHTMLQKSLLPKPGNTVPDKSVKTGFKAVTSTSEIDDEIERLSKCIANYDESKASKDSKHAKSSKQNLGKLDVFNTGRLARPSFPMVNSHIRYPPCGPGFPLPPNFPMNQAPAHGYPGCPPGFPPQLMRGRGRPMNNQFIALQHRFRHQLRPSVTENMSHADKRPLLNNTSAVKHAVKQGNLTLPSKKLVMLRGLPGSGKSTLARLLATKGGVIISADDYFLRDGRYCFNSSDLSEAHEWSQRSAKHCMESGFTPVIIDNTNTRAWEMRPYVLIGLRCGYKIDIKEPETWWKWNIRELLRRNTHNITKHALRNMLERYEKNVTVESIVKASRPTTSNNSEYDLVNCETKKRDGTVRENSNATVSNHEEGTRTEIASQVKLEEIISSSNTPEIVDSSNTRGEGSTKEVVINDKSDKDEIIRGVIHVSELEQCSGRQDNNEVTNASLNIKFVNINQDDSEEKQQCKSVVSSSENITTLKKVINRSPDRTLPINNDGTSPCVSPCSEHSCETKLCSQDDSVLSEDIRKELENLLTPCDPQDSGLSEDILRRELGSISTSPLPQASDLSDDILRRELGGISTSRLPQASDLSEDILRREFGSISTSPWPHTSDLSEDILRRDLKNLAASSSCSDVEKYYSDDDDSFLDIVDIESPGKSSTSSVQQISNAEDNYCEKVYLGNDGDRDHISMVVKEDHLHLGDNKGVSSASLGVTNAMNLTTSLLETSSASEVTLHEENRAPKTSTTGKLESKEMEIRVPAPSSKISCAHAAFSDIQVTISDKTSRDETSRGETSRGETSRGETSRDETCRGEASRGETSRDETSRGETSSDETSRGGTSRGGTRSRVETSRGKTSRGETSRGETSHGKTSSDETSRGETSRAETSRGETSRGETSRNETSFGGTSRGETSRGETSRGETSRDETSSDETSRGETSRGETSRGETSRDETSRDETSRGKTSHGETSRDPSESLNPMTLMLANDDFATDKLKRKEISVQVSSTSKKSCAQTTIDDETSHDSNEFPNPMKFLLDCFSHIPVETLQRQLNHCDGDLMRTVNSLIEYGKDGYYDDMPDSTNVENIDLDQKTVSQKTALENISQNSAQSSSNSSLAANFTQSKDISHRAGREKGAPEKDTRKDVQNAAAVKAESPSSVLEDIAISSLHLTLEPALALQLLEIFGPFSGIAVKDILSEDALSVEIDKDFAKILYTKWKKTVQKTKNIAEVTEAKRAPTDFATPGSNSRRKFKTPPRTFYLPDDVQFTPPNIVASTEPVSLKEIMDEQLAIHVSNSEQEQEKDRKEGNLDLSTKLKRSRLHGMFPGIDVTSLNEIFEANNYNLDQTVQLVQSSIGGNLAVFQQFPNNEEVNEAATNESQPGLAGQEETYKTGGNNYQSFADPTYKDFRAEAETHFKLRDECIKKAAMAYSRKQGELARVYADQARAHGEKIKEGNRRAAEIILMIRNNDLQTTNELDLHELHVNEAIEVLKTVLAERKAGLRSSSRKSPSFLQVITGRGNRSRDGKPRIKPAVVEFLKRNGYRFEELNMGFYRVYLN